MEVNPLTKEKTALDINAVLSKLFFFNFFMLIIFFTNLLPLENQSIDRLRQQTFQSRQDEFSATTYFIITPINGNLPS